MRAHFILQQIGREVRKRKKMLKIRVVECLRIQDNLGATNEAKCHVLLSRHCPHLHARNQGLVLSIYRQKWNL